MNKQQTDRYLKSKQFQKDCSKLYESMIDIFEKQVKGGTNLKYEKFSEYVMPTVIIQFLSLYFQNYWEESEEAMDSFLDGLRSSIVSDLYSDYDEIHDIGAQA